MEGGERSGGDESEGEVEDRPRLVRPRLNIHFILCTLIIPHSEPIRQATAQANEVLWRKAHTLYIEAFDAPPDASHVKKLAKLKKNKVLPPEIHAELFEYESFLVSLGKMSLSASFSFSFSFAYAFRFLYGPVADFL